MYTAANRLLAACLVGIPLLAAEPLTTEQVLNRMLEADRNRMARLHDYVSLRHYVVHNTRFGTRATMTVKMSYRAPGLKQFEVVEQSGPGPVRNQVFKRMLESERHASEEGVRQTTTITPDNYTFQLLEQTTLNGRSAFVLQAEPKTRNTLLFRGKVWVDGEDYAVVRIEGTPAQKPSFWVRKTTFVHQYQRFGSFWLAVSNHSDTDVLVFGHTAVDIRYEDYKINQQQDGRVPGGGTQ